MDGAGNVGLTCSQGGGFMTNDEYIAEVLERDVASVDVNTFQLLSGRTEACEKCLPRLVTVILRALRQSTRAA